MVHLFIFVPIFWQHGMRQIRFGSKHVSSVFIYSLHFLSNILISVRSVKYFISHKSLAKPFNRCLETCVSSTFIWSYSFWHTVTLHSELPPPEVMFIDRYAYSNCWERLPDIHYHPPTLQKCALAHAVKCIEMLWYKQYRNPYS